ncbi:MAG: metallophosphoesterase family protein [Pseudomonadota bacterium]
MKILAFSDLHHNRARADVLVTESAQADLVIGAGDFCNHRKGLPEAMNLMSGLGAPMLAVPGNAESDVELQDAAHVGTTVLHGTGVESHSLRFFGIGGATPVTPFGHWSWDLTESEAEAVLARCEAVDVLISHSPPKGAVDVTSKGVSIGSEALRAAIERLHPALVLCGHVHDCWGQEARIGASRVVNLGPAPHWFEL